MGDIVTLGALAERLAALPQGRHLVALAGAPGSGKSTLAKKLAEDLNDSAPDRAAVVPMDGFHYDDRVLRPRGHLARKGAPHTFDVDGLRHLLLRLKANDADEIAIPVFDRRREIARAAARIVPRDVDILLIEGNYLLLDQPPWDSLKGLFELTVMIDVPEETLRRRLTRRWVRIGMKEAGVTAKLEENDLPNGRLVRDASCLADLTVKNA